MIWLLRALLAAAVFAAVFGTTPAPGLDEALWLGGRVLSAAGVASVLGPGIFTVPDAPTGAFGWLAGALAATIARAGGAFALELATGLAIVGVLALVEVRARRVASAELAFGAAALAALSFADNVRSGGGAAGWLAAAAFMLCVAANSRRGALASVLLAVLWCNLSPAGFFAPWIALLVACGASLEKTEKPRDRTVPWLTVAGCAVALFATPAGLQFVELAPAALHLDGMPAFPVSVVPLAYRFAFPACLLLATLLGLRGAPPGGILLTLAALLVALVDGHQLPLLGIVAAPVLAGVAAGALRDLAAKSLNAAATTNSGDERVLAGPSRLAFAAGAVLVAMFAFATWSAARTGASNAPPLGLIARLQSDGRDHRLFCTRLDWCGSALATGDPHLRAFMDQREAAYPQQLRREQFAISIGRDDWRAKLKAAHVDAFVVDHRALVAGLLETTGEWTRAAEDDGVRLYLRTTSR
jgi:hypothetical protein